MMMATPASMWLESHPTDAVATVTASCICGSDLHGYRGHAATTFPRRIGHEFIGVVSATGPAVTTVRPGDLVIAPFAISDGTRLHCRNCASSSFARTLLRGTFPRLRRGD
jgi:threonine dehydrogenase-like Zn-dependent dehydrogenase